MIVNWTRLAARGCEESGNMSVCLERAALLYFNGNALNGERDPFANIRQVTAGGDDYAPLAGGEFTNPHADYTIDSQPVSFVGVLDFTDVIQMAHGSFSSDSVSVSAVITASRSISASRMRASMAASAVSCWEREYFFQNCSTCLLRSSN